MANYRPVSNVTIMSNIVECAVAEQLQQYLEVNGLLPRHCSLLIADIIRHMLRVFSDVLTAADAQQVTLLGLLDLSAAFDCVDHQLLLHRLHRGFGLTDTVLNWVTSFVTGRSQQVVCNGLQYLQFGVPQRSVLDPILFVMYTAELSHVVAQRDLKFHQYADACQIYVYTLVNAVHSAIDRFSCCLEDVEAWMTPAGSV